MQDTFKARLKAGKPTLMVDPGASSGVLIEALAAAGVDAIFVDCEEDQIGLDQARDMVRRARTAKMASILRPTNSDPQRLRRYLQLGVDGLMVPHVERPEEVAELVNIIAAARPDDAAEVVLIIMVESLASVDRIPEFLQLEAVDAICCGAGDLGLTMGITDKAHPVLRRKVEEIMATVEAGGKISVPKALPDDIDECRASGARLLVMLASELLQAAAVDAVAQAGKGR